MPFVDYSDEQNNVMRQPMHVKMHRTKEAALPTRSPKTPDEVVRQYLVENRQISSFRAPLWARKTSCPFVTQSHSRYFQFREKIQESRRRERTQGFRRFVCSRLPTLLSAFAGHSNIFHSRSVQLLTAWYCFSHINKFSAIKCRIESCWQTRCVGFLGPF